MTQDASHNGGTNPSNGQDSALDREADRIDGLTRPDPAKETEHKEGERGLNNPSQVEQDNRIDKARAEARAAGGGPDEPEGGLNPDG